MQYTDLKRQQMNLLNHATQLHSERLTLKLMSEEHWPLFLKLNTDPQIMYFVGNIQSEQAIAEKFADRVKPWLGVENQWRSFICYDNQNNIVALVGFRLVSKADKRVEIGYIALPEFAGKGYVLEAAKVIIAHVLALGIHKIVANCCTDNIASWKIMEKLGMSREGEFKDDYCINGKWLNSYSYGLCAPKS